MTALFADISGFTALASRLDTEELLGVLDPILEAMARIVARYDGWLEKFAGDALLALFGAPVSHEDDAVRAIRAAEDMHAELASLSNHPLAQGLALHVGITTGDVVARSIKSDGRAHYAVLGESVILAQRLESLAPPGETYVGASTAELASDRVRVRGSRHRRRQGPTGAGRGAPAHRTAGTGAGAAHPHDRSERGDEERGPRARASAAGRCGLAAQHRGASRHREVPAARRGAIERVPRRDVVRGHRGRVVLPRGLPVRGAPDRGGARCSLPRRRSSVHDRLRAARVGRQRLPSAPRTRRCCSVSSMRARPSVTGCPKASAATSTVAALGWLLDLASHRQVVVLVDNVQWLERSSVELLADLAAGIAGSHPVLLCLSGRSLLEPDGALGETRLLRLDPLSADQVRDLIVDELDLAPDERLVDFVVDRCNGGPAHGPGDGAPAAGPKGCSTSGHGHAHLIAGSQAQQIPSTLESMLNARLDTLAAPDVALAVAAAADRLRGAARAAGVGGRGRSPKPSNPWSPGSHRQRSCPRAPRRTCTSTIRWCATSSTHD